MAVYNYDDFIEEHVGTFGKCQVLLSIMAALDMLTTVNYVMLPVFISSTPTHSCAPPPSAQNCSVAEWRNWGVPETCTKSGECSMDSCLMYKMNNAVIQNCSVGLEIASNVSDWQTESCSSWTYDKSFYAQSAVEEFDLVCDRRGLANSIAASYMLGRTTGAVLLGWIGDKVILQEIKHGRKERSLLKIGRRRSMLLMTVLTFGCALGTGLAPNIYVLLGLRFATAAFDMARSNVGFIMGVEYIHKSKRAVHVGIWGIVWSCGYLVLLLFAFFFQQWRTLLIVSSIPEVVIFILYYVCLPESPRWLLLQRRKEEAKAVIEKMAKYNGKTLPKEWDIDVKERDTVKVAKMSDLLRSPVLALLTIVMAYLFIASAFIYYGLSLNSSNLAGNPYFNFFISGAVEIPAYIALGSCYEKMKRRPPYVAGLVLGGLTMLMAIIPIPPHLGWIPVMFCMIGKFFATFTFMVTWLVVTEVFPTAVRVSGLGITNGSARIGSIVAAYITLILPMHWCIVFFSASAILAGVLVLFIPETHNIILPQTVSEGEAFVRKNICKVGSCNKMAAEEQETQTSQELKEASTTLMNNERVDV